jgi:hypothetical protein
MDWLYEEFKRQAFGRRDEISCVQFIERLSCLHNKNRDPNSVNLEEMFPKMITNTFKDDVDNDMDDPKYSHLKLPQLLSMGVNDWFDPVFLQKRIEKLLSYNDIQFSAASISAESIQIITERE